MFKNTQRFAERLGLQSWAEVPKLFNRVRCGYPGRALGNRNLGAISGRYNDPRLVQLKLRLLF